MLKWQHINSFHTSGEFAYLTENPEGAIKLFEVHFVSSGRAKLNEPRYVLTNFLPSASALHKVRVPNRFHTVSEAKAEANQILMLWLKESGLLAMLRAIK